MDWSRKSRYPYYRVQRGAGVGEEFVTDPAHGEGRGSGGDPLIAKPILAYLSAGHPGAFEHPNLESAGDPYGTRP
ncbi:hypothetical protein CCR95_06755 [Thiocystis minor]|nr:hypothetical protein [Thiocystis minor]